jgi:mannosyl-oligosaccharide glucosidase
MHQGIEGPIVLTGSTPELDDFTIRIVDGAFFTFTTATHLEHSLQARTTRSFLMVRSRMLLPSV